MPVLELLFNKVYIKKRCCKIFSKEHPGMAASELLIIKLVIKHWASPDLLLINNIAWMVSTQKVCRSGQSTFVLIISRNHSNMFLLIDP